MNFFSVIGSAIFVHESEINFLLGKSEIFTSRN